MSAAVEDAKPLNRGMITVSIMLATIMQAGFSLQSELRTVLMGLASRRRFATLCIRHCSTCVALDVRAMMT